MPEWRTQIFTTKNAKHSKTKGKDLPVEYADDGINSRASALECADMSALWMARHVSPGKAVSWCLHTANRSPKQSSPRFAETSLKIQRVKDPAALVPSGRVKNHPALQVGRFCNFSPSRQMPGKHSAQTTTPSTICSFPRDAPHRAWRDCYGHNAASPNRTIQM